MAFPQDLADVVIFKVHPAVGVARVSDNEDYYIFGTDPGTYKSNGLMKRQAVQFRIFAYGENYVGLGELTPAMIQSLNIQSIWSAKVANRKLAYQSGLPLNSTELVISAEASSNDANNGKLTGSLPNFEEGVEIPLGQISPNGLFIPPKGSVHRKTRGTTLPNYPALSTDIADTTSDGSISVSLVQNGHEYVVLPACIIVAPQDFSPDDNPSYSLNEFFARALSIPQNSGASNLHNDTARTIDRLALQSTTADFAPGMETSFGRRGEVTDVRSIFYQASLNPFIDPLEARIKYKSTAGDQGAVHGQLTSGLCSTWQGDFTACVGYWNEHLPANAYLDEQTSVPVNVFRKRYADTGTSSESLESADDFDKNVDKMGVVRIRNGKKVETERDPGNDV